MTRSDSVRDAISIAHYQGLYNLVDFQTALVQQFLKNAPLVTTELLNTNRKNFEQSIFLLIRLYNTFKNNFNVLVIFRFVFVSIDMRFSCCSSIKSHIQFIQAICFLFFVLSGAYATSSFVISYMSLHYSLTEAYIDHFNLLKINFFQFLSLSSTFRITFSLISLINIWQW